jgi:hypothetical protein
MITARRLFCAVLSLMSLSVTVEGQLAVPPPLEPYVAPQSNRVQTRAERDAEHQRQRRRSVDAKGLLAKLCATDPATGAQRVCVSRDELTADEAWLVLNYACRFKPWGPLEPCATFRVQRGAVLNHNFKTGEWDAQWEERLHPLDFDVAGTPTMRLRPKDAQPLKIVITEISPLTYSVAPGAPKEDDLAVIAGLKTFLSLAGSGIQGVIQTISSATLATQDLAAAMVDIAPPPAKTITPQMKGSRGVQKAAPACELSPFDVSRVASAVTARDEHLSAMLRAMRALQEQLDDLEQKRSDFIRVAQRAEDGKPVSASELIAPNVSNIESAYGELLKQTRPLTDEIGVLEDCRAFFAATSGLLNAPVSSPVIETLARRVQQPACTHPAAAPIKKYAEQFFSLTTSSCSDEQVKKVMDVNKGALLPLVERLASARQHEEKLWAAGDKALAARKDVIAAANMLTRQVQRGLRHTWSDRLIRELVVTRQNPELPWSKVQSHEVIMKADSPYVKEVSLSRGAEEKRTYKLESATGQLLGYSIGLTYTPLHESTFGALTVPGTTTKVIGETNRTTRAGDLAAFLTYRFMEHAPRAKARKIQPTAEFGVGLTSDRPAFFLGAGLELFRAGRLGLGWSPQRVSVLAPDQIVNQTVVASSDEIKTVKRFDTSNYYVSFTFALDSLSLFNKP